MHPHVLDPNTPVLPEHPRRRLEGWRPVARWLRSAFRTWQRRKMISTLQSLDDHLLGDIGIDRSEIPRVVDRLTDRELEMRPVSRDVERATRSR